MKKENKKNSEEKDGGQAILTKPEFDSILKTILAAPPPKKDKKSSLTKQH